MIETISTDSIQVLIAAIESGYWKNGEWVIWAEKKLQTPQPSCYWIVDLFQASNQQEALNVLYQEWVKTQYDVPGTDQAKLLLGFLYIQFLEDKLSINELLLKAGDFADRQNLINPSCEELYLLLNKVNQLQEAGETDATLIPELVSLFSESERYLCQQIQKLKSD